MTVTAKRAVDRRIQRTEHLLHDALAELIHEKPYDSIAVKEILDRANVGRSTFYTHFRDKDELLVTSIREMLSAGRSANSAPSRSPDECLWFSLPFFTHLDAHRLDSESRMGPEGRAAVHCRLQRVLARMVAEELRRHRGDGESPRRVPSELLAEHVAATFVLVLDWWTETDSQLSAAEIDAHFRTLARPAVAAWMSAA